MQPKRQKFIYIILLVGVLLVFFWERDKLSSTLDSVEKDSKLALSPKSSGNPTNTLADANNAAGTSVVQNPSLENSVTGKTPEQFAQWLKNEASSVDRSDRANADKEAVLRQLALQFTPENISYLRTTATAKSAPANEKIVAVYLLTLATSSSQEALQEIAQTPFSLASPQPAHSIGETTLMQEKAIRVVAIDELFIRLENDTITRQQLEATIQKIPDLFLRQYALKRLAELK